MVVNKTIKADELAKLKNNNDCASSCMKKDTSNQSTTFMSDSGSDQSNTQMNTPKISPFIPVKDKNEDLGATLVTVYMTTEDGRIVQMQESVPRRNIGGPTYCHEGTGKVMGKSHVFLFHDGAGVKEHEQHGTMAVPYHMNHPRNGYMGGPHHLPGRPDPRMYAYQYVRTKPFVEDKRKTTIILRNIPCKTTMKGFLKVCFSFRRLESLLQAYNPTVPEGQEPETEHCADRLIDLFHFPRRLMYDIGFGYAFANFRDPAMIKPFVDIVEGMTFPGGTHKVLTIEYADIQGLPAIAEKLKTHIAPLHEDDLKKVIQLYGKDTASHFNFQSPDENNRRRPISQQAQQYYNQYPIARMSHGGHHNMHHGNNRASYGGPHQGGPPHHGNMSRGSSKGGGRGYPGQPPMAYGSSYDRREMEHDRSNFYIPGRTESNTMEGDSYDAYGVGGSEQFADDQSISGREMPYGSTNNYTSPMQRNTGASRGLYSHGSNDAGGMGSRGAYDPPGTIHYEGGNSKGRKQNFSHMGNGKGASHDDPSDHQTPLYLDYMGRFN